LKEERTWPTVKVAWLLWKCFLLQSKLRSKDVIVDIETDGLPLWISLRVTTSFGRRELLNPIENWKDLLEGREKWWSSVDGSTIHFFKLKSLTELRIATTLLREYWEDLSHQPEQC